MPLAGMKRKKNIETPSKASLQDSLWLLVLTNVGEKYNRCRFKCHQKWPMKSCTKSQSLLPSRKYYVVMVYLQNKI